MEKHLILTGADSAACSEIIKTALDGKLAYAGGYVTEAESAPNSAVTGYALLPAAGGYYKRSRPHSQSDYRAD